HLLNNATEATSNILNPEITISMEVKKEFLSVCISDNGKGIPEENRAKIFLPFFTTKEIGAGPGLGLSVSRKIIEDHGGTLIFDEHANQTTFKIVLPLA
ncbi:MAG: ATP-binding protein, partial [Bacteriovorax sp.]|nr:ATP-binding protein [Bacteriovorax sp.]